MLPELGLYSTTLNQMLVLYIVQRDKKGLNMDNAPEIKRENFTYEFLVYGCAGSVTVLDWRSRREADS
jgi:hypothetical protein